MAPRSLRFELALLSRMPETYRRVVFREIGLAEADALAVLGPNPPGVPDLLNADLAVCVDRMGPEVSSGLLTGDVPEVFAGSTVHCFLLLLWPHLHWVVNRAPNGSSWGAGFQNQAGLRFKEIDPSLIRVGLWTRKSLEAVAESHVLYDGWEESVAVRFRFGARHYEGAFVFGLLQEWREL